MKKNVEIDRVDLPSAVAVSIRHVLYIICMSWIRFIVTIAGPEI